MLDAMTLDDVVRTVANAKGVPVAQVRAAVEKPMRAFWDTASEQFAAEMHAADNQLRNQFANNFMLGYMIRNGCTIGQEDHVAKRAFVMADAMLAASKEKTE